MNIYIYIHIHSSTQHFLVKREFVMAKSMLDPSVAITIESLNVACRSPEFDS